MATNELFGRMCARVCQANRWKLLPTGVSLTLDQGRTQLVELEIFQGRDHEMVRLRTGIGPTAPLSAARAVDALRANATLSHGALAILDDKLIMTDTLVLADADPDELESAIRYLAVTADFYERTLYQVDES